MTERRPNKAGYVLAATLLPLAFCLALAGGVLLNQLWLPQVALASKPGHLAKVCVSVRLTGGFRVATWWGPAISGRTGKPYQPFIQTNMACGLAPWLPALPRNGNLESSE
ncbi:MAG: hypothetical protein HYZ49_16055 [Chloroflexi bacterium]|nr:hypothetical protein [Chloroflexota bacterium]